MKQDLNRLFEKEYRNYSFFSGSIPEVKSQNIFEYRRFNFLDRKEIEIDLTTWSISGGWKPGKYHVILRMQYFFNSTNEERQFDSDISIPIKFDIT